MEEKRVDRESLCREYKNVLKSECGGGYVTLCIY